MSRYQNPVNQFQLHFPVKLATNANSTCTCAGSPNPNENWIHNEAHGGLFGVYMNKKDGLPGCSFIRGFFIWRSFDHGIYFQVSVPNFFMTLTLNLKTLRYTE